MTAGIPVRTLNRIIKDGQASFTVYGENGQILPEENHVYEIGSLTKTNDLAFFGHVFENMVLRDLLAYAQVHDASVLHYSDDSGLEADAVYQLPDGRYALIEIKTGVNEVPTAEKGLLKFVDMIREYNKKALANPEHPRAVYREPTLLITICANAPMSYKTESGVFVIPVGCLRD